MTARDMADRIMTDRDTADRIMDVRDMDTDTVAIQHHVPVPVA